MNREPVTANAGWVLFGGCLLAFFSSAVNADFMLHLGVSVSHLTGDLSRISSETVESGWKWSHEAAVLCLSLVGFVAGAATSGFFIHHPNLHLGRPYGRSVITIGALLVLAGRLQTVSVPAMCFTAAWACGMQNALATRYRGVILRTTHITGLLTDFGQLAGMRLRGHPIETWKISTPMLLAGSFAAGSMIGAWMHLRTSIPITVACGVSYIVGGVFWSLWKRLRPARKREDGKPS